MWPKLLIFDRDNTLNVSSSDPNSPFYYILDSRHLILKPRVCEAVNIIRVLGIPVILATKQRCISKGLVSTAQVDKINRSLERKLQLSFEAVFVEPEKETKRDLYAQIVADYRSIKTSEMMLFDDSKEERDAAMGFSICTRDGSDLYAAVCEVFKINP